MFYRNILERAWDISWKNKYLWFFGLFAIFLGNGGEVIYQATNVGQNNFWDLWKQFYNTGIFSHSGWEGLVNFAREDIFSFGIMIIILATILILFTFIIWLIFVSQAAIVNCVAAKTDNRISNFHSDIGTGIENFWKVFSINILSKIVIFIVFSILGFMAIKVNNDINKLALIFIYTLFFILFSVLAIIISFIAKYAIVFVVTKKEKFLQAIKNGLKLFENNWLVSLEMSLFLFFLALFLTLAFLFLVFAIAIPVVLLAIFLAKINSFLFLLVFIIGGIALLIITIIFGSLLTVFQTASWTILTLDLLNKKGSSKIERLINSIKDR